MKKVLLIVMSCLFLALPSVAQNSGQNVTLVDIQDATNKIREKEKELMAKEQMLNEKEIRLNALEQDLITREANLTALRNEITTKIDQYNNGTSGDIGQLARLYAQTKPRQAAAVMIQMDLDQSAALMRNITAMTAGRIMDEIAKQDPVYASRLTTKMAGETVTLESISSALGVPVP